MWDVLRGRGSLLVMAAALGAVYVAAVLAVLAAAPLAYAGVVVVATGLDVVVERRFGALVSLLRRAQFGISHRAFLQVFLLLLLISTSRVDRVLSRPEFLAIMVLALAGPAFRMGYLGLLALARRRLVTPVEVRNIELPDKFRAPTLPSVLTDGAPLRLLVLGAAPVLGGALSVWAGVFWPFYVSAGAYAVIVALAGAWLVWWLMRLSRRPSAEEYLDAVSRALLRWRPEVVLYHSGSSSSAYQVDMWLPTLERMRRPGVVLLRERHTLRKLARTDVPVLCVPRSVDVMSLPLPDARLALYVANVGNNIHLLREPRLKHVFIGHGDSDKVGSFNPFSKVYDEVWVAGRAGRDRYARARVGVRDDAVVEVGRPQVDDLARGSGPIRPSPSRPLTVLYLPTWEGWTDDDFQTSLTHMGGPLLARLLASPVPLRVLYRPHPLTGVRDPRARAANARLRAAVEAAAAAQGPLDQDAAARLAPLAARLRDDDLTAAEERELVAEWNAGFWAAHAGRHLVVSGGLPSLFDCFDRADLLVADVSSVVSDFIATGKPYAVANPKGLPDEEFRAEFPSASAAYLLHPGCEEVDGILAAVTGEDPLSPARDRARTYLLGPDHPSALARWDAAVEHLLAVAHAEWDGVHGSGPTLAKTHALEIEGAQGAAEPSRGAGVESDAPTA